MQAQNTTLQQRLLAAVFAPMLLFAVLVALAANVGVRRVTLDLVLQRNTALVQVAAASLGADLTRSLQPVMRAAARLSDASDLADQRRVLADSDAALNEFGGGVALLDVNGIAIATTPGHEERLGLDYSFREYFRAVRSTGQPAFSTVLQERPSGQDAVVVAAPVSVGGQFAGALVGVRFLSQLPWERDLAPLHTEQGGQAYLVDAQGVVINHPDVQQVGRAVAGDGLGQLIREEKVGSLLIDSPRLARRAVASYAPLPDTGWGLVMEEPWAAIAAPASAFVWLLNGLLVLSIAASLTLLWSGIRKGLLPLRSLVTSADRVSAGEAFEPLPLQGPRDVRTLTAAFNRVITSLAEQRTASRRYASQVLHGQEEERKRIARDLHDGVVQDLVALLQRLDLLKGLIVRDPAAAKARTEELQDLTKRAVADVRRMSNDLRPMILEDLGLVAALRAVTEDAGNALALAHTSFTVTGVERRLPAETELTLFRVAQESLTNVRKHAAMATHVGLRLGFEADAVHLVVTDDGPGFSSQGLDDWLRAGHLGLAGMHERAALVGGRLQVTSKPGAGTQVLLELPDGEANT